jgi:hypothetical protein
MIAEHVAQVFERLLAAVIDADGLHVMIVRNPRDAARIGRRAAEEFRLFDDKRLEPMLGRHDRGRHARYARADHDHIEFIHPGRPPVADRASITPLRRHATQRRALAKANRLPGARSSPASGTAATSCQRRAATERLVPARLEYRLRVVA